MILSIGLMVKNEEKNLDKCLNSLRPILENLDSELVIVDTGSTDRTIDICRRYTSKVFCYKWNNDFAEARNEIIKHCRGDWYFSIDADEVIENSKDIIEFFKNREYKKYNSAVIKLKNLEDLNDSSKYTFTDLPRLFKRDKDFKYVGAIHEQPQFKMPMKNLKCVLQHYGYIFNDKKLMEVKFKRNKEILEKEITKDDKNIYLKHQLATTYCMHNDIDKSLEILRELYYSLSNDEKKVHKYVMTEYTHVLILNKSYDECIKVCAEVLSLYATDELYKIDIMYYMARCLIIKGQYEKCIEMYCKYIILLNKYENNEIAPDISINMYTLLNRDYAYKDMALASYNLHKYYDSAMYCTHIEQENVIEDISALICKCYFDLRDYNGLINFYRKKVECNSQKLRLRFLIELENQKMYLTKEERFNIEIIFSSDKGIYGLLNKYRCFEDELTLINLYGELNKEDINILPFYYGDVLMGALKKRLSISTLCSNFRYDTLIRFIEYCATRYSDNISDLLFEYVNINRKLNFDELRINIVFCRSILILSSIDENKYFECFKLYVKLGIQYIYMIYSRYIIDNELSLEMKNNEDMFFLFIDKAEKLRGIDKKEYIRYLKKSLQVYPEMKKGIERLLEDFEAKFSGNNNEMELLKKRFIDNINLLISCNKINEARSAIEQYEQFIGIDSDLVKLKLKL